MDDIGILVYSIRNKRWQYHLARFPLETCNVVLKFLAALCTCLRMTVKSITSIEFRVTDSHE